MARVLIVDDEPDVRELFNITLKMAGHATETSKDGMEAVDRLANGDIPDLILLDLMMPRLDGYGLLQHIRTTMDSKPVRVLVATAKVLEDADNQKLSSWPVVGVLNKGELDISAMVTVISTALSKEPYKKTDGEAVAPAVPAASAPAAAPAASAPAATPAAPPAAAQPPAASPTPAPATPATPSAGTPAPETPAATPATPPSTPPASDTPAASSPTASSSSPAAPSTPTPPAASPSSEEKPKESVTVTTPPAPSGDKPEEKKP